MAIPALRALDNPPFVFSKYENLYYTIHLQQELYHQGCHHSRQYTPNGDRFGLEPIAKTLLKNALA
jgi:hypothetical protein